MILNEFLFPQMTLHLCWNLLARCHHRCREMLLSSLLFWVLWLEGEGHPGAPSSVRGHPVVGAKAKVKTRQRSVKRHLHNKKPFTRLRRWDPPQRCLWPESVVVRLFCSRKLRMGPGWLKTSPRCSRMRKQLTVKRMGWRAPLLVQNHPVWPTSQLYLPLQTPPLHPRLPLRITWGPEASAQRLKQTNSLHHPKKQVVTQYPI